MPPIIRPVSKCLPFLACLLILGSCSDNPLPGTPSASSSPAASDQPVQVVPTAPPDESENPQEIPTAPPDENLDETPAPTKTPRPDKSPSSSQGTGTSFVFRARVVSDKGEVLPVSKAQFTAMPYNLSQLQQELAARNDAGPKPLAPKQSDAKYQIEQKVCTGSGCTTELAVDTEAYRQDLERYTKTLLPDWEEKAYAGLDDAIEKASDGRETLRFTTDAKGEANLQLPTGVWYFNGKYSTSSIQVVWDSIPFTISTGTKAVELTR